MNYTFYTNTIWYVILGILTLFELILVIVKAENRCITFAFYLTILGITLCVETILLIFLKAYTYYPLILKNPPYQFDDVLAGNLFSQTSVAVTALMIAVFNSKYYWVFILAGIYGIIEESFIALGIYKHNWYQTWMTVCGIFLLFWIVKKIYMKIIKGIKSIFYYGYIFLSLFPLNIVILSWGIFVLCRLQDCNTTLLIDPFKSRHLLFLIHFCIISIPIMFIYFSRLKWNYNALVILGLYLIYYIGYKLNLFIIKDGYFPLVSTLTILWMYLSIFIMDRLYSSPLKKSK